MTETCTNCGYPTDLASPSCTAFKHPRPHEQMTPEVAEAVAFVDRLHEWSRWTPAHNMERFEALQRRIAVFERERERLALLLQDRGERIAALERYLSDLNLQIDHYAKIEREQEAMRRYLGPSYDMLLRAALEGVDVQQET